MSLIESAQTENTVRLFPSIAELLEDTAVTYEDLLRHDEVIEQLLTRGIDKLDSLRLSQPKAAGLIVATDINHAQQIAQTLDAREESWCVVTNKTPKAQRVINTFRHSDCRWIVAVGMISEGTDIPRLQVCCFLSRIRTELHYRQVLGRILRRVGDADDQAWLFMLAETTLQQFAERIADDLPEDLAVVKHVSIPGGEVMSTTSDMRNNEDMDSIDQGDFEQGFEKNLSNPYELAKHANKPNYYINFSQHYRQLLLTCF